MSESNSGVAFADQEAEILNAQLHSVEKENWDWCLYITKYLDRHNNETGAHGKSKNPSDLGFYPGWMFSDETKRSIYSQPIAFTPADSKKNLLQYRSAH
jgi:hypothetical protein